MRHHRQNCGYTLNNSKIKIKQTERKISLPFSKPTMALLVIGNESTCCNNCIITLMCRDIHLLQVIQIFCKAVAAAPPLNFREFDIWYA